MGVVSSLRVGNKHRCVLCPPPLLALHPPLSITLKAGVKLPGWLWGAIAQWPEDLQLKREILGSIPSGCPGFFLFQLAY